MTEYYAFGQYTITARDRPLTVVGKPGVWSWDRPNPGTLALLDVCEIAPGDAVLDLGCGTGIIGAAATMLGRCSRLTLIDSSAPAAACATHTIAANRIAHAEVRVADGAQQIPQASFDVVLSHLPRGRSVQEELIDGAAWSLRPGGTFCFVASTRTGIKGAIRYARERFGRCGVVRQKKGYHVAFASRPTEPAPPSPCRGHVPRTVVCDRVATTLMGKPGVFAWDRLDDGTAALIDTMEIGPSDHVLDLGCGSGLAGLAAARRARSGDVALVDADVRAVESARLTLAANEITNAEVMLSDCGAAVFDRRFDVVVTNPPFHRGAGVEFDVAHQFVRDARRVLRPGGHLFLVANRHLRYSVLVGEVFGSVSTAFADGRFQVLRARAGGE